MLHRRPTNSISSLLTALFAVLLMACALKAEAKEFVVVVDAGHGGKDSGALGKSTKEKDINLAVAKLLADQLSAQFNDVKVILTRSTDVFVTIKGRMDKAKAVKADLFVSIHCNSAAFENPRRTQLSGTSVYVLGTNNANDNIDLAMRENSAILLEDDYKTTYKGFDNSPEYYIFTEINQSKMMGKSNSVAGAVQRQLVSHAGLKDNHVNETSRLWLLLHSTMPAILVELDFICNPNREQFLASAAGQKKMAEAISLGIYDYRSSLGHTLTKRKTSSSNGNNTSKVSDSTSPDDLITEQTTADPTQEATTTDDTPVFKIQFLSTGSAIPAGSPKLKGLTADYYRDGATYKYTFGSYPSSDAAAADLKEIRKKFPDAFVIKTIGGQRVK